MLRIGEAHSARLIMPNCGTSPDWAISSLSGGGRLSRGLMHRPTDL